MPHTITKSQFKKTTGKKEDLKRYGITLIFLTKAKIVVSSFSTAAMEFTGPHYSSSILLTDML